jgi:outer membrane receptor protein involved in Fe transport
MTKEKTFFILHFFINHILGHFMKKITLLITLFLLSSLNLFSAEEVEEIIVTGSQIKGAKITGALPVSILSNEQLEAFGIDSGDELLDTIAENGMNQFNEQEWNGGVNASRGDVGAFNLRSVGVGDTLVLLNGRRVIMSPGYQTEAVGGSFVPVSTVNSNTIPVYGVERTEILKDGASAIYGADAVAGVVNTVLQNDFEGLTVRFKGSGYETIDAQDFQLNLKFGTDFNEGKSNIGIFADLTDRDNIKAKEDPRWANSDLRHRLPDSNPWYSRFRNSSVYSVFGTWFQGTNQFVNYPITNSRCEASSAIDITDTTNGCLVDRNASSGVRTNLNEYRDVRAQLDRINMFVFLNHEMTNGNEAFFEFGYYDSETSRTLYPEATLGGSAGYSATQPMIIPVTNYYVPNSIEAENIPLAKRYHRFPNTRQNINERDTYRFLAGIRGRLDDWDWEGAVIISEANAHDVTFGRHSMTLLDEALADTSSAAMNPFSGGVNSNHERALITEGVHRKNETTLDMFDFKISNPDIFSLPSGPVGMVIGLEYREESFTDDRDNRLDGTIAYTTNGYTTRGARDNSLDVTFPYVSDVVNSSPTPDSYGERDVMSLFAEFQLPITSKINTQLAIRHEDFSDVGTTTVGKFAAGWQITDYALIRGSFSQSFRGPNLITVNESQVARNNGRTDWVGAYITGDGDTDVTEGTGEDANILFDVFKSTQRIASGSDKLVAEEGDNWNLGLVLEPLDGLIVTYDEWSIEKENTIGLFGEENHTILDLLLRLRAGTSGCNAGNPNVVRFDPDPSTASYFEARGLCNVGQIQRIEDIYVNLDTRKIEGKDIGLYYTSDTKYGDLSFRYNHSKLTKLEQTAGGSAAEIIAAQASGELTGIPSGAITGFSSQLGLDGNYDRKSNMSIIWRYNKYYVSLSQLRIGEFFDTRPGLRNGEYWKIPSMKTVNVTAGYNFDLNGLKSRVRIGIKNLEDERAPLADKTYGYYSDAHRDYGRNYYIDLRVSF